MTIYQQRPTGGCINCDHAVRTRKTNGWVCDRCNKLINRWPQLAGTRFCVNCGSASHHACYFNFDA